MESGGADISRSLPSQREESENRSSQVIHEEPVRAPIAPRQETLIGHDEVFMHDAFTIHGESLLIRNHRNRT